MREEVVDRDDSEDQGISMEGTTVKEVLQRPF
jgi:hypothetical protein